jgi:putative hydrolase of the HAD superfamily
MDDGRQGPATGSRGVDAVLFDFGGVLAEEGFREGLRAIGRVSGVDPDAMARAGFDLVHRTGYVTGRVGEPAFWQALREQAGARGSDEALRREILSRFVIRPWMIDLVDRLGASGLTLGILSDQTQWLDEIDEEQGLFRHFHHVFNSYHTGVSKRDPAAFDRAVNRMGLPAAQVLFVDDHAGNVERARERGLRAVLYLDRDPLLRDLARHLPPGSPPAG